MTAVIVGYARTPFTRFTGAFASIPATVLGAHAITAALACAGVAPDEVLGASGARIVGTLARQLHDLGPGSLGAVGICGGGGQGSAIVLRGV